MFALNIEIINCFTYSRKLYTKMYMSRKSCWHDATILSVDWRCQQNVGGADVHTSSANRSHAGIAFTHWFKNGFFAPQGCSDKRQIWHGGADHRSNAPCQISYLSGQKCENTAPKTVKMWNFVHNFTPQGDSFAKFLRNYQHLYASVGRF